MSNLSISVEVAAPKDLSAFIKGAYRHCCHHLIVCLAPCNLHSSALLIVQRRHLSHAVAASRSNAKSPALGNATKILQQPSTKESSDWRPWYDCAPPVPSPLQRLYTLWHPGPLFLYLASTFVSEHPHVEGPRLVCTTKLLDRNGHSADATPNNFNSEFRRRSCPKMACAPGCFRI